MGIQVLIATMNQKNIFNLLKKMNIQSDAIVANQCNKTAFEEISYNGQDIKFLSFQERGVGLNRNNALMRASKEISIIADDDLVYVDGYSNIIEESFKENYDADIIIFNLIEKPKKRFIIEKTFKVNYFNFMRFGAARIAFKTKSITMSGISFNLHFGGGAEYSAGEDTLFLYDCLRKNLKIVAVPIFIAYLSESRSSTWFNGYTEKYFVDKGVLYSRISMKFAWLLSLQFCIRHRQMFNHEKTWLEAYRLMLKGIKSVRG